MTYNILRIKFSQIKYKKKFHLDYLEKNNLYFMHSQSNDKFD